MTNLILDSGVLAELDTSAIEFYSPPVKKSVKRGLPLAVVERLLDKLANDDEYRSFFQRDPIAALESVGVENAIESSDCIHASLLPSKDSVRLAWSSLLSQLTSNLSHTIFKVG